MSIYVKYMSIYVKSCLQTASVDEKMPFKGDKI